MAGRPRQDVLHAGVRGGPWWPWPAACYRRRGKMGCAQEGAAGNGFLEPPSAAAAPLTVPHGGMSFLVLLHMPPSAVTAPSKWDGELGRLQYLVGAFTKREGPLQLGGLIGFVTLFHIVVQPDCMTNHCPCSVYQDQHRFSTSNGIWLCHFFIWHLRDQRRSFQVDILRAGAHDY